MGGSSGVGNGKGSKDQEKEISMDIVVQMDEVNLITHEKLGDLLISGMEEEGYSLYYDDVYHHYSTIDFRKKGYKYNILLVPRAQSIECSTSAYKNILFLFFKKYNHEKLSSFDRTIRSILVKNALIKEFTNNADAVV
jgi:hypothetical protein